MSDAPGTLTPKYPSEFFLEFRSVDRFLYRASDLYEIDNHMRRDLLKRLDQCHIYFLGKRPRLSAVPSSLRVTIDAVHFDVQYRIQGNARRGHFSFPRNAFSPKETTFEFTSYPHQELISRNEQGDIVAETILANIVHLMPEIADEAKDLEVMYIGKGLRRSAHDRMKHHKTLQKLLAKMNSEEPDSEVFAVVHAFDCRKNVLSFSNLPPEISGETAKRRRAIAMAYKPSLSSQVDLIEACCISQFRPDKYNKHYLNFPEGKYPMLDPVYEADLAALTVQVDHTNIGGQRLFSKHVTPSSTHFFIIDFRRRENKMSIFPGADDANFGR